MVGGNGKSAVARVFNWKTIPLFWILFSVFISLPRLLTSRIVERGPTFVQMLYGNMLCSLGWIIATPVIILISRRFFISGPRWFVHLLIHLVSCAVFCVLTLSSFSRL